MSAAERARGLTRTLFWLFAPLIAAYELLRACGWSPERLPFAPRAYHFLAAALPPLDAPSDGAVRTLVLALVGALCAFNLCPPARRKDLVLCLAVAQGAWVMEPRFALCFALCAAAIWGVSRAARGVAARFTLAAPALVLLWIENWRVSGPGLDWEWGMTFALTFKAVSYLVDTAEEAPGALRDYALHVSGGFPVDFRGPLYIYSGFTASWDEAQDWERTRQGILRIHSGLAKIALTVWYESQVVPLLPAVSYSGRWSDAWLGGGELWLYGSLRFAVMLVHFSGHFELVQGLTRLFGYAPLDQMDRPWLAVSPLDFWRRFAGNTVRWMMKYVFFPLCRLAGREGPAVLAVFAFTALLNVLRWRGLFTGPLLAETTALRLGFYLAYGAFGLLFLAVEGRSLLGRASRPEPTGARRAALVLVNLVLAFLLRAPTEFAVAVLELPPGVVAGVGPAARTAELYRRLLFIP